MEGNCCLQHFGVNTLQMYTLFGMWIVNTTTQTSYKHNNLTDSLYGLKHCMPIQIHHLAKLSG